MKKSKLLLITLFSLSLVGCSRNISSSLPTSSSTSETSSSKDSSTKQTTSKESSSKDSSTSSSSSSTSSSVDYYAGWSSEVEDAMKRYLGGNVVPFINVGTKSNQSARWDTTSASDYGHLTVEGNKELTAAFVTTAKNNYVSAGWTNVDSTNESFTATSSDNRIKVVLSKDSLNYAVLTITYDEPYDKTKFTAWDSESTTNMNTFLGETLPLFYLGTANPTTSLETNSYQIYDHLAVQGGKWDDRIVDDMDTLVASSDGWIQTTKTNISYTAKKTTTAGDTIEVSLVKETKNTYSSLYIAKLIVTIKEAWNPEIISDWPTDIKDAFDTKMKNHGHSIPFIYLGSRKPAITTNYSTSDYMTITGGTWNDEAISLAKAAFDKANLAEVTSPETKWIYEEGYNYYGSTLIAKKSFSDTCDVSLTLSKNYEGNVSLTLNYYPLFISPTGVTSWSQNVQDEFTNTLDGHSIPYFWIGTTTPGVSNTTYKYATKVIITGTTFNSKIIKLATSAFNSDSWNKVEADEIIGYSSYGGSYMGWKKTFEDGHILQVEIEDQTEAYSPSDIQIDIYMYDEFDETKDTNEDWTNEILAAFRQTYSYTETDASGNKITKYNTIPYFYTGTKNPYLYSSYYSASYMEICGGKWNDKILALATTAFENDKNLSWTIENSSGYYSDEITATSSYTPNKYFFQVNISATSYNTVDINISYIKGYDEDLWTTKKWTSNTITCMKNYLNNHVLPSFYIGTEQESATSTSDGLKIEGGTFDERILTNFTTALDADTSDDVENTTNTTGFAWVYKNSIYNNKKAVFAYKKYADGSYIRLRLQATDSSATATTELICYYDKALTATTDTSWSDKVKTKFTSTFGTNDVLPFFNMNGTVTALSSLDNSSGSSSGYKEKYVQLSSDGDYSDTIISGLYDALVADVNTDGTAKWDIKTFNKFYNEYGSKIEAMKKVDGGYIYVSANAVSSSYDFVAYVTFLPEYVAHDELTEGTTWTEKEKKAINKAIKVDLPYVALGNITFKEYTDNITIKGNAYSDTITEDVYEAFTEDGYNCAYYYSGYYKYIYGNKDVEIDGETRHISFNFYSTYSYTGCKNNLDVYIR